MKMEQTECSETSAYKIQTPGNYPEENIQHTEPQLIFWPIAYSVCFIGHSLKSDSNPQLE